MKDVLLVAGGLADGADRSFVARYMNLAQKVGDGVKIYVPKVGEGGGGVSEMGGVNDSSNDGGGLININTASVSELDSLWGIGASRAQDIINGRPYGSVEELAKVIPSNVYEQIKGQISIY